jgi:hypothetical protein
MLRIIEGLPGGKREPVATLATDELDKHGFQWLLEWVVDQRKMDRKICVSKVIRAAAGAAGKAAGSATAAAVADGDDDDGDDDDDDDNDGDDGNGEGEGEAGDEDPNPPQLDSNGELEWLTMQLVFHMLPLLETAVGTFKEEKASTQFSIDTPDQEELTKYLKKELTKYLKNAFEAGEVSDIAVGVCLKRREITTLLLPKKLIMTQKDYDLLRKTDLLVQAADNTSSTSVDSEAQNDRSSFVEDGWSVFATRGESIADTFYNPLHKAGLAGVTGGAGRSAGRSAVEQSTADTGRVQPGATEFAARDFVGVAPQIPGSVELHHKI